MKAGTDVEFPSIGATPEGRARVEHASQGELQRALSENRDRYIEQSAGTRGGRVPELIVPRSRALAPIVTVDAQFFAVFGKGESK